MLEQQGEWWSPNHSSELLLSLDHGVLDRKPGSAQKADIFFPVRRTDFTAGGLVLEAEPLHLTDAPRAPAARSHLVRGPVLLAAASGRLLVVLAHVHHLSLGALSDQVPAHAGDILKAVACQGEERCVGATHNFRMESKSIGRSIKFLGRFQNKGVSKRFGPSAQKKTNWAPRAAGRNLERTQIPGGAHLL